MANTWWVSDTLGSDANPGTFASPFQTLKFTAERAGTLDGDTIMILPGTYTGAVNGSINIDKSLSFEAAGMVTIATPMSDGWLSISNVTANRTFRYKNLIFKNYLVVKQHVSTGFDVDHNVENCIVHSPYGTSGAAFIWCQNTTATTSITHLFLQNNTFHALDNVAVVSFLAPGGDAICHFVHERNNIYDVANQIAKVEPGMTGGTPRTNHSYNAVPNADAGVLNTGEFDITVTPPNYTDITPATLDLSLVRSSNTAYIGSGGAGPGDFGNDIGATWWSVTVPRESAGPADVTFTRFHSNSEESPSFFTPFPSNWAAADWENDPHWYDSAGMFGPIGSGPDTFGGYIAHASPSYLETDHIPSDPRWTIHPFIGGGWASRLISQVLDLEHLSKFKSISFSGHEFPAFIDPPGLGYLSVIDANETGPNRTMWYRASNTPFTKYDNTGSAPAWSTVKRNDAPSVGPFRYWQFRIMLSRINIG